ncbi:carbamoyltransferase C-terminal domain-containing protein [Actinomadura fulvescens]|uniref:Nodulation protein U n=1 Tax=Actinomadura fulvescens TaxID=46160 RepID=A0ABP6CEI5_9ACTN
MRVLALKPGHDGAIAYVDDGRLVFSLEGEKDSFPRYAPVTERTITRALELAPGFPDVIATGGWHKPLPGLRAEIGAGYYGLRPGTVREGRLFGEPVTMFTSTHERSHILTAVSMAPGAPLRDCAVLVWEGRIGAFYLWRDHGADIIPVKVLDRPGARYAALFALADEGYPDHGTEFDPAFAGKLMALAAYATEDLDPRERGAVEELLRIEVPPFNKGAFRGSRLYNAGVHTPVTHAAARYLTDRIFAIYHEAAVRELPRGLPLVISGGCGLNCEWNRRWRESGLFSDVFVPPCANDSGSAIGTAMDAAVFFGDPCRLEWDVYAGDAFHHDVEPSAERWRTRRLVHGEVARALAAGAVVAWVRGRYEIGPRALGHRSLLAAPFDARSRDVLNRIKGREDYRPVGPCCRHEELHEWFDDAIEDPYMLYVSPVRTSALPAVTHVDGSARVQSVRAAQEPALHRLLTEFRRTTGYGVLCNTSLNFQGRGFVNTMSELVAYCELRGIDEIVVDDVRYSRR